MVLISILFSLFRSVALLRSGAAGSVRRRLEERPPGCAVVWLDPVAGRGEGLVLVGGLFGG